MFCVAAELGDYDAKRHNQDYVSEFRFVPCQTEEFETRVMHIHASVKGIVPALAEYRYLDKSKWLDMYGVDLHPVQVSTAATAAAAAAACYPDYIGWT